MARFSIGIDVRVHVIISARVNIVFMFRVL